MRPGDAAEDERSRAASWMFRLASRTLGLAGFAMFAASHPRNDGERLMRLARALHATGERQQGFARDLFATTREGGGHP